LVHSHTKKDESLHLGVFSSILNSSIQGDKSTCPPIVDSCAMLKIEGFNALQTPFGPSKIYLSQNNLQNATPN
jgi:hypothetical protein